MEKIDTLRSTQVQDMAEGTLLSITPSRAGRNLPELQVPLDSRLPPGMRRGSKIST